MKNISAIKFLLLLLFVSFIALPNSYLAFQIQQKIWWKPIVEEAMKQLEAGSIDEAEKKFKSIVERDDEIAEAYIGLGLAADKRDPGCRDAEKYLKQAFDIDDENAKAYYYLGIIYSHKEIYFRKAKENFLTAVKLDPDFDEAWTELERVEELLNNPYPEIVKYLSENVKRKKDDKKLYSKFLNAVVWYSEEKAGIKTLNDLYESNPERPEYLYDIANFYYMIDEFKISMDLLDSLKKVMPEFSQFKRTYLYAKNLFGLSDMDKGCKYYMYALSMIKDSTDSKIIFDDICYIMDDEEYKEFESTPLDKLYEYFMNFWLKRDPNHASEINERIPEHYERLITANKEYRRYSVLESHSEFVHKMNHPLINQNLDVKTGDNFLRPYLSKADSNKYFYDDMGLIFIRHGLPDKSVYFLADPKYGDYSPDEEIKEPAAMEPKYLRDKLDLNNTNKIFTSPTSSPSINMSWLYFEKQDRPEMIFHFVSYVGKRGWQIESLPWYLSNRQWLNPAYRTMRTALRNGDDNVAYSTGQMLLSYDNAAADTAMKSESTGYKFENGTLGFPFTFLTFKGKDGKEIVELYYGLDGKQIEIDTANKPPAIPLSKFIGLYDFNRKEIGRIKEAVRIPVSLSPVEWKNRSAVLVERFESPPGKYFYEFELTDRVSKKFGYYRGLLDIKDYSSDTLAVSDIIVSGPFETGNKNTSFKKKEIIYDPHFFSPFEKNETVGIYYEVYNLKKGKDGLTDFEQRISIKEFDGDAGALAKAAKSILSFVGIGKNDEVILTSNYRTPESDPQINLQLDLSKYPEGKYLITITIKDKLENREADSFIVVDRKN